MSYTEQSIQQFSQFLVAAVNLSLRYTIEIKEVKKIENDGKIGFFSMDFQLSTTSRLPLQYFNILSFNF